MQMQRDISNEIRVQWLVSPKEWPEWVRQGVADLVGRKGLMPEDLARFRADDSLVYGYAELSESAIAQFTDDNGQECFMRRYFYRRPGDSEGYKTGECPIEAAAPGSIEPGVWGISPYKKSQITVRVPTSLLWRLNAHIQSHKISQSELVVKAIESYLNRDRKGSLDERVEELEKVIQIVLKNLNS